MLSSPKVGIRLLGSLNFISIVRLFLLGCSAAVLVFFLHFHQPTETSFGQIEMKKVPIGHRRTCCLSIDRSEDICGRPNCTAPCLQRGHATRALENDLVDAEFCSDQEERAFFLETSGSGSLNFRQACSVESLALHNPNLTVNVLFFDAPINGSFTTLWNLREKYSNVRLISIDTDDYMAGTPLEHWYHCTDWKKGPFHVSHLSDALRFLTLRKYGGYYFDLDVIIVQPVTYYRNFVGAAADDQYIASGVIHAGCRNIIMDLAVKEFARNYRPDIWAHNGPHLLLRVLKNWCKVEDLQSMNYVTCRGFNVLPKSSFQPVHYLDVEEFFAQRFANETPTKPVWLDNNVIGVHTFNNLSKKRPIYKNSTQIYTGLARDNCPVIFSIAPEVF